MSSLTHQRLVCASVIAAASAACQLLVGIDAKPTAPVVDATTEDRDSGHTGCGTPAPPPPDARNSGVADDYVFLLRFTLSALDEDGGTTGPNEPTLGFDIDCKDTRCEDESPAIGCRPRGSVSSLCDEEDGIDNQARRAGEQFSINFDQTKYDLNVAAGRSGILLALTGYSGEADDPFVGVAVFPSSGIRLPNTGCAAATNEKPADGGPFPPTHDGCDIYFAPASEAPLGSPLTTSGYVRDGELIVTQPMKVAIPYYSRMFRAESLVLRARLAKEESGRLKLVGTLGGRIPIEALFEILAEQSSKGGAEFCRDPALWETVRAQTCEQLDLPGPNATPDERCGAMSFGVNVIGTTVRLAAQNAERIDELRRACADASFECPDAADKR